EPRHRVSLLPGQGHARRLLRKHDLRAAAQPGHRRPHQAEVPMRASLATALLIFAACDIHTEVVRREPTSFRVEIVCAGQSSADCPATCPATPAPVDSGVLGSPITAVDRLQLFYLVQATAIDSMGKDYPAYNGTANVYMQFEGSVTPARAAGVDPLATLPFQNGHACRPLLLPDAFN